MQEQTHRLQSWGLVGAFFAAVFAVWMLFFPDLVKPFFAWDVRPRLSQVFIGAGYIFRTGFFLAFWRERYWARLRWAYWGNLAFTGALLLATFWHVEEFGWFAPTSIFISHLWVVLYISEPLAMIFRAPRGAQAAGGSLTPRGPVAPWLKRLLMVEAGVTLTLALLLIINPPFIATRWSWSLVDNPLDSRIIAAWFAGWTLWAGAMALAEDWDEIRLGIGLNILFGLALLVTFFVFLPLFDFTRRQAWLHPILIGMFTLSLVISYAWHERRHLPAESEMIEPIRAPN